MEEERACLKESSRLPFITFIYQDKGTLEPKVFMDGIYALQCDLPVHEIHGQLESSVFIISNRDKLELVGFKTMNCYYRPDDGTDPFLSFDGPLRIILKDEAFSEESKEISKEIKNIVEEDLVDYESESMKVSFYVKPAT